jgi:hypothetical protein
MINTQPNPRSRSVHDGEVRSKTGRGWFEWQGILDAWNPNFRSVREATAHLKERHGLSHFWAQVVATHYFLERVRQ